MYRATEGEGVVTLCALIMNFAEGSPRPFTLNSSTDDRLAGMNDNVSSELKIAFETAGLIVPKIFSQDLLL